MDSGEKYFSKYLVRTTTVDPQAYPNILLEPIIAIILVVIFGYLCHAINQISCKVIRPESTDYLRKSGNYSRESVHTRVQHEFCKYQVITGNYSGSKRRRSNGSNIEWLLEYQNSDFCKPILEERAAQLLKDKLVSALTPCQMIKLDKERQLRDKILKGCTQSLTSLIDTIAKKTLPERLKMNEPAESGFDETDSEYVCESTIKELNAIIDEPFST